MRKSERVGRLQSGLHENRKMQHVRKPERVRRLQSRLHEVTRLQENGAGAFRSGVFL